MIAGVLVEVTNKSVDRIFDYIIPKELENRIMVDNINEKIGSYWCD